jgi:hypothetical protein
MSLVARAVSALCIQCLGQCAIALAMATVMAPGVARPMVLQPVAQPSLTSLYRPGAIAGVTWLPALTQDSNGISVHLVPFTSPLAPAQITRSLAQHGRKFQRFLVFPGLVILSGFHNGLHWVACIQRHGQGSRGYVSSLPAKAPTCESCQ